MGNIVTQSATGKVVKYNSQRGFGFVTTMDVPDEVGLSVDAFFHISDVPASSVKTGWRFEFDLEKNEEGYRATNISITSREAPKQKRRSKIRRLGIIRSDDPAENEVQNPHRAKQIEKQSSKDNEDSPSEEDKSPFSDDIRGSKNDLLK